MNIGIFLKQFKKSPQSIVEDIHHGKSEHYGSETLWEILKLLPESEEVKKLKSFNGDVSKLSLADSFLYCLIQVPNYSLRIEAMVLKKEFMPSCSSLYKDITTLRTATKELMSCAELHSILHLVLQAGNIMNAGGYAGNAVGFKLSSLLKLADTKANKPGMTLLHFVAQEAQKQDAVLLNFSEKLQHVQETSRLSLDVTEAELRSLFVRTKSLQENIQRDQELCQQLQDFLQFAVDKLAELDLWKRELQGEAHTLIDFFCEDKETMKLDECFQIFRDFCTRFNKAVKDNHEREEQERKQLQRLKELEQKRHSWTTGELGGFGRSSSENDVQMLAKKGAEDTPSFLKPRPSSPSCRPPNTRRSRLSLGMSADRELLTFLESTTGTPEDPNKFNSLPRSSPRLARPTIAWMETREQQNHDSNFTHEPQVSKNQEKAPHPAWQSPTALLEEPACPFALAGRNRAGTLRKRNSEPVGLVPAQSPPLLPLDLGIREHELVTGLTQFDLQSPKSPEEASQLTLHDFCPTKLQAPGDAGDDDGLTPEDTGPQEALSPAAESEPGREARASVDDTDTEDKDPGPLLCGSDTTDCSLTLDCSEGTDSRRGEEQEEEREEDVSVSSHAGEAGSGQVSSNPASSPSGEVPAPESTGSDPTCQGSLPKDRPSRGKDAVAPKRNSLKETAQGASKPVGARRSQGASKPVRTLNSSENEHMRKVVPISKSSRGAGTWKRLEPVPKASPRETPSSSDTLLSRRSSVRGTSDTSPRRAHTSGSGAEEPRLPRSSGSISGRPGKDPLPQPRASFRKPSAKPLRNIPRQKPEEHKVSSPNSGDHESLKEESKAPEAPSVSRALPPVPSFARNTVASSSRSMRPEAPPAARGAGITRTASQRQLRVKGSPEDSASKGSGTLKRASSARASKKGPESAAAGVSAHAETPVKARGTTERSSLRLKDSGRATLGRLLHPLQK
ncbi:FH2 domain-containing protein 1 isoform X2 [Psammomys obesus]|nr:FH2 domain-containing protein 1 isoform X2 [Psammomys obesus]